MTERGTGHPHLPDPQHDRHVAFPADGPEPGASPAGSLPPEAWAPKPGDRRETVTSTGSPPAPWILASPPHRPMRRQYPNRRGPAWLAALVAVPLFFGLMNGASGPHDDYSSEMGGPQWPGNDGGMGMDSSQGSIFVEPFADTVSVAPPLPSGSVVKLVPPGTSELRIEVVSRGAAGAGGATTIEILGGDGSGETNSEAELPLVRRATLISAQGSMDVTVTTTTGTTEFQCRVYAGTVLVALDTATSGVSCSVTW